MTVLKILIATCLLFCFKDFEIKNTFPPKTEDGYVKVFGKIDDSLKPLENVKIRLMVDDLVDTIIYTDKKGKYNFGKLNLKHDYTIWISKENYCSKYAEIKCSSVPENALDGYYSLMINSSLFKVDENLNKRLDFMRNNPAAVATYNESASNFTWDMEALRKYQKEVLRIIANN